MKSLTVDEIKSERANVQKAIDSLQKKKTVALEEGKIGIEAFNEISATQGRIQNKLNELNVLLVERAVDDISLDDDSPAASLGLSVQRLNKAINRLDEIRNFLDSAASVINALNVIIGILAGLPVLI